VSDWESGRYHTNLVVVIAEPFRLQDLYEDFSAVAIRPDSRSDTVLGQKRYLSTTKLAKMRSGFMIIYKVGIIVFARDIMNSCCLSFYHLC
jgi:hypothetical protein